jgi:hypothetical protein
MANTIRIKRSTGSSAPASLANAELAYSEGGNGVLWYGVGTGGAGGSATSIVQIGGAGMASLVVDTRAANIVFAGPTNGGSAAPSWRSLVAADLPDISSTYLTVSSASSTYLTQSSAASTYLSQSSASTTYAPLASPTLTGTPAAPTATSGTNTTQIATTAFVSTAISNLVNGAGAALDTLQELASALGNDANFATTITTSIGTKLTKSDNLSDLTNAGTARTNLGLGTIATQAASSVSITGGSITNLTTFDGITIDGGTYS